MPNIIARVPEGAFDSAGRTKLAEGLTRMAKQVEQIGDSPRHEFLTWVTIEELRTGYLFAGGMPIADNIVPVTIFYFLPAGVIDAAERQDAVRLSHQAVKAAMRPEDRRTALTSVIVTDVSDGHWGANGVIWRIPDFVRAAGFRHLQRILAPETDLRA